MQIQENRKATGAPADPFNTTRETQQGFALPATNSEFNLFAEVFNSFAASSPPSPTDVEPSPNNSLPPVTESTLSKDEDDLSDDQSDRTGLTPYVLPVGRQPVFIENVDASTTNDFQAESIDAPAIENTDSQLHSASVDSSLVGNAGKVPSATVLTEVRVDEGNVGELLIDQSKKQDAAPENHVARSRQAIPSSESTDTVVPVSQEDQQPTSQLGDTPSDRSKQQSNAVATMDATQVTSVASDDSQSSDRENRPHRNRDSDHRTSDVGRQESVRDVSKNAAIAPAPSVSGTLEAQSPAISTGFSSTESAGNAAIPTASQVALAAASSLAAPQTGAIQRAASGSVTQGVQSASGAASAGSVTRGGERSAESVGADSTPNSRRTDIADRARLVHRISKAFQKMGIDSGQVRLKMHPDELGGVQIEMQVNGRSVKAKVTADGEVARQLLQDSLPELRQRLESQGLTVERLDVELRSEGERSSLMNQNHQQQQSSGSNDEAARRDGVWRRPAEVPNVIKVVDARPEPRLHVRSVSTDRSLDLKV